MCENPKPLILSRGEDSTDGGVFGACHGGLWIA
jgi:hypothetical protein